MNIVDIQHEILDSIDFPNRYDNSIETINKFPALVLDVDESVIADVAGLSIIGVIFDFAIIDIVDNHNGSICETRRYVAEQLPAILDSLRCKIVDNIKHFDTIVSGKKASMAMCKIEY